MDDENTPTDPPQDVDDASPEEESGIPPEKKVQVNDEPQVYTMDPNSTDVTPVEPPPKPKPEEAPCPPAIDQEHLNKIICESKEISDKIQKYCYDQKLTSQKLAFMLNCIEESICLYSKHICKLNTFLLNNDKMQVKWFCQIRSALRCYGDYTLVLKDDEEPINVDEFNSPCPSNVLKELTDNVVTYLLTGGSRAQGQRSLGKTVYDKVNYRNDFVEEHLEPFKSWNALLNKAANNQDVIMDKLFKVSANITFLDTAEISEALVLDLVKEMEALENEKASTSTPPTTTPP